MPEKEGTSREQHWKDLYDLALQDAQRQCEARARLAQELQDHWIPQAKTLLADNERLAERLKRAKNPGEVEIELTRLQVENEDLRRNLRTAEDSLQAMKETSVEHLKEVFKGAYTEGEARALALTHAPYDTAMIEYLVANNVSFAEAAKMVLR